MVAWHEWNLISLFFYLLSYSNIWQIIHSVFFVCLFAFRLLFFFSMLTCLSHICRLKGARQMLNISNFSIAKKKLVHMQACHRANKMLLKWLGVFVFFVTVERNDEKCAVVTSNTINIEMHKKQWILNPFCVCALFSFYILLCFHDLLIPLASSNICQTLIFTFTHTHTASHMYRQMLPTFK